MMVPRKISYRSLGAGDGLGREVVYALLYWPPPSTLAFKIVQFSANQGKLAGQRLLKLLQSSDMIVNRDNARFAC